jgi:hypothetical protein
MDLKNLHEGVEAQRIPLGVNYLRCTEEEGRLSIHERLLRLRHYATDFIGNQVRMHHPSHRQELRHVRPIGQGRRCVEDQARGPYDRLSNLNHQANLVAIMTLLLPE